MSRRGIHPLLMGLDKRDRKAEDKPLEKPDTQMAGLELPQHKRFLRAEAEDGIRDFCLSRGLGDVYKRQGDEFLFCSLLRPPMQISRLGLSALPRETNLSFK